MESRFVWRTIQYSPRQAFVDLNNQPQNQVHETFRLAFNAIASDPQLIECADGPHEAAVSLGFWKFFPVYFNRRVYQWFSNYVRSRKRFEDSDLPVEATDIEWMNVPQLKVARRLSIDPFNIQDVSEIDRLIAFKQGNLEA